MPFGSDNSLTRGLLVPQFRVSSRSSRGSYEFDLPEGQVKGQDFFQFFLKVTRSRRGHDVKEIKFRHCYKEL